MKPGPSVLNANHVHKLPSCEHTKPLSYIFQTGVTRKEKQPEAGVYVGSSLTCIDYIIVVRSYNT